MDELVYREEILEHWQNPLNFGVMDDADLVVEQVNPLCGDEVRFYFKFSRSFHLGGVKAHPRGARKTLPRWPNGLLGGGGSGVNGVRVEDVSFTGSGCAISIASASMLSEAIKGKSLSLLSKITGEDVLKLIGGSIVPARLKCAFLALEAVKKLVSNN